MASIGQPLWRWQVGGVVASAPTRIAPTVPLHRLLGWHVSDPRALVAEVGSAAEARAVLAAGFAAQPAAEAMVTAYFEPHVAASMVRTDTHTVPLLARPADLAPLPPDAPLATSGFTAAFADASQRPYHTRAEIEAGALGSAAQPLAWLDCAVQAFVVHVQGSACLSFADGTTRRITFDGKNGHPYTSIARTLIEAGELPPTARHAELVAYLLADATRGRTAMQRNASYAFFRWLDAPGPIGSSGRALLPGLSLAADPAHYPPGSFVYVVVDGLADAAGLPFARIMRVDDTGSAIRGAGRGDIYWGSGEAAGRAAGAVKHQARLYRLVPL